MKTINKEFLKKFENYDNQIRPNPEEPLEVTITLLVQSWNPIIIFTRTTDFRINLCLNFELLNDDYSSYSQYQD